MSAAEAIAAVEELAVRTIQAEALLKRIDDLAAPTADGRFWQVPADAIEQTRKFLRRD